MFEKVRTALLLLGLLGILAACSAKSPPLPATTTTDLPSQNLTPTATVEIITSSPTRTAGPQVGINYDCENVQEIPTEECEALLALYESTQGDYWQDNSGWLAGETPCTWYGVICKEGHIVELQLFYNQLVGSLPAEIGNLTHLKSLYLDDNQLSGPLPPEIGNLARLQLARLGANQFNSIPAEMAKLKSLVYLELWGNQLSGNLPGEISKLSNLQELKLGFNQFSGSIPPELGKLAYLHQLDLSHNQLSGRIPAELGNLINLDQLDLSFNQITGTIPLELEGLPRIYWLDLSYNNLTGVVPATIEQAPMSERRLWGNLLNGTILALPGTFTPVEYQGVYFEFSPALAESVWPEIVAAQPPIAGGPGWDVRPEQIRFTFAYPREPNSFLARGAGVFGPPQILIFPTETYSVMSELAKEEIEGQVDLLKTRPSVPENEIPLLPLINAAQVFHAQTKYLDFQNGSGVRFVTQYSQDVSPITNQNIYYTFQGMTGDDAYYVAVYFPIASSGLTDELVIKDWNAFNAEYQDYLAETISYLDNLSSHEFEPDLSALDELIQSLVVNIP